MSTVQLEPAVAEGLVVSVTSELQAVAARNQLTGEPYLTGSAITSAIKTVAVLDFSLRVAELPDALLGMFSDAKRCADHIFELDAVIQRIVA
jgi:hypothetical protein